MNRNNFKTKNDKKITILFLIFILPIPFSVVLMLPAFVAVMKIIVVNFSFDYGPPEEVFGMFACIIGSTYLFVYPLSYKKTLQNKKISFISFLPVINVILVCILLYLSSVKW